MFMDREPPILGDFGLPSFDFSIDEFLDLAALDADQVIVVPTLVEFEHCLAGFEMMADKDAGLLELRQHTVDRCQPDIHAFGEQHFVNVLGGQVSDIAVFEQVENFQTGKRRLQSGVFQIVSCAHDATDRDTGGELS